MSTTRAPGQELPVQQFDSVVIRFAGDSGDGMQITGNQFTHTSAVLGNDLATFPDFPAEIRAPAGTRPGQRTMSGTRQVIWSAVWWSPHTFSSP